MLLIHRGARGTCAECGERIDGAGIVNDYQERFCSPWCAAADPCETGAERKANRNQRIERADLIARLMKGGAR